ncbi:hypothetical protein [Thiolapillus sp.]
MNYSNYMMRDRARDVISSLDRRNYGNRQQHRMQRLRSLLEIGAFVAAVASYLAALSLMA